MDKRNKLWRNERREHYYEKMLRLLASYEQTFILDDGTVAKNPKWETLKRVKGFQVYKSTRKPCSCPLCSGDKYDMIKEKREKVRILREETELNF